jgi:hypothetical protein
MDGYNKSLEDLTATFIGITPANGESVPSNRRSPRHLPENTKSLADANPKPLPGLSSQ